MGKYRHVKRRLLCKMTRLNHHEFKQPRDCGLFANAAVGLDAGYRVAIENDVAFVRGLVAA